MRAATGGGQGVLGALLARQGLARLLGSRPEGVGEPQTGLLRGQPHVLARHGVDGLDLAEAEPQLVGLTGALTGRTDHLGQVALGLDQLGPQARVVLGRLGDVRTGEPVEGRALCSGLQEPVLVGLTVHGDQRLGDLGQYGHGHRGSAHPGPGTPLGRDVAGQHDPVLLDLSPGLLDGVVEAGQAGRGHDPLDARAGGARAHCTGVGATAQQEPEGRDDHRLAGPGLTGDHGQAGPELERRGVDDAEGRDPQLLKHRTRRCRVGGAPPRRASPRRAGRTWPPGGR